MGFSRLRESAPRRKIANTGAGSRYCGWKVGGASGGAWERRAGKWAGATY